MSPSARVAGIGERLPISARRWVVLDDQNAWPPTLRFRQRSGDRRTSPFAVAAARPWNNASSSRGAADAHRAALGLDDALGERQPKPVPCVLLRPPTHPAAGTRTKSPLQGPGVGCRRPFVHLDRKNSGPLLANGMATHSAGGVNFERIGEIIVEHLLEAWPDRAHRADGRVHRNLDATCFGRGGLQDRAHLADRLRQTIDSGRKSSFPDSTSPGRERPLIRRSRRWLGCSGRFENTRAADLEADDSPSWRSWVKPRMALSGVRSSCDMFARNCDLYVRALVSPPPALVFRACAKLCTVRATRVRWPGTAHGGEQVGGTFRSRCRCGQFEHAGTLAMLDSSGPAHSRVAIPAAERRHDAKLIRRRMHDGESRSGALRPRRPSPRRKLGTPFLGRERVLPPGGEDATGIGQIESAQRQSRWRQSIETAGPPPPWARVLRGAARTGPDWAPFSSRRDSVRTRAAAGSWRRCDLPTGRDRSSHHGGQRGCRAEVALAESGGNRGQVAMPPASRD